MTPVGPGDFYPEDGEYVVWVGRSQSHCSACGGNADPNEAAHIHGGTRDMWDRASALNDMNGCRAAWVRRVSVYAGASDRLNWTDMTRPLSTWNGPAAGDVIDMTVPTPGGLFTSHDGGETWVPVGFIDETGLASQQD